MGEKNLYNKQVDNGGYESVSTNAILSKTHKLDTVRDILSGY